MTISVHGSSYAHLGYGSFVRNLVDGLRAEGHQVWMPDEREYRRIVPRYDVAVWATVPSHAPGRWEGQYVAAYTMWESNRVAEAFRCKFHCFDRIVAPCDHNVELFSQYHPDVVKVPLGYDSRLWRLTGRHLDREFRFLCAGAGLGLEGGRKGFDIAVKAFAIAFPDWETMDPQPKLVTKSLRQTDSAPFVEAHVGQVPVKELVGLVHSCHAYVGPSRGEGWGYWPQQAVATGIPAVVSAIPAHMEYAHLPGFYTCPVREVPADYFAYGAAGTWWEPDVEAVAAGMRAVYDDWEKWHVAAALGAREMAQQFTFRHMARGLLDVLGEGNAVDKWIDFEELQFPLEVSRKVECDIGDSHWDFTPGLVYEVPADVLRVMREAGYAEVGG